MHVDCPHIQVLDDRMAEVLRRKTGPALLAERRRKLVAVRELRNQQDSKLRQRCLPWTEVGNCSYPMRVNASL